MSYVVRAASKVVYVWIFCQNMHVLKTIPPPSEPSVLRNTQMHIVCTSRSDFNLLCELAGSIQMKWWQDKGKSYSQFLITVVHIIGMDNPPSIYLFLIELASSSPSRHGRGMMDGWKLQFNLIWRVMWVQYVTYVRMI